MVVMKFGGTSVASAAPIRRVAGIVSRQPGRRVVVVSALAGVTDRLLQAAELARAGRSRAAAGVIDGIASRHVDVAAELGLPSSSDLSSAIEGLRSRASAILATGAAEGRLDAAAIDRLLATGELMSSRLVAAAFAETGIPATWVDPRSIVVTDDAHGAAAPDLAGTTARAKEVVLPLLDQGRVPITGGFVGATSAGATTTLGRGGSDVTA